METDEDGDGGGVGGQLQHFALLWNSQRKERWAKEEIYVLEIECSRWRSRSHKLFSVSVDRISYSLYSPIYQLYREHEHTFAKRCNVCIHEATSARAHLTRVMRLHFYSFSSSECQRTPMITHGKSKPPRWKLLWQMNFVESEFGEYPVGDYGEMWLDAAE